MVVTKHRLFLTATIRGRHPGEPEEMARAYYAAVKEEVDSELAEKAKQEEEK